MYLWKTIAPNFSSSSWWKLEFECGICGCYVVSEWIGGFNICIIMLIDSYSMMKLGMIIVNWSFVTLSKFVSYFGHELKSIHSIKDRKWFKFVIGYEWQLSIDFGFVLA